MGLSWASLGWAGQSWAGLGWSGLDGARLGCGLVWTGLGRSELGWSGLGWSDLIHCGTTVSEAVLLSSFSQLTLRRAAAGHVPPPAPTESRLLALDMLYLSCLMTN